MHGVILQRKPIESAILILLLLSRGRGQKQSVKKQSDRQLNAQCNAMNLINKVHCNEV